MLIIKSLLAILLAFPQGQVGKPPVADHDFKMSVTEVVYSSETKAFEVKFYLFTDDLTATLAGDKNAPLPSSDAIGKYILQHFEMSVNGGKQVLTFQSIRQKNDQVLATFSTPIFNQKILKIKVKNSLIVEKFKDQTNMVYALLPNKGRETKMLNASTTEGEFSF